ncbi:MAG: hypothetical protein VYD18_01010 [Candidatus Latescibacterota bacterium]|nr:hypothetical protein [Candidatus Latescibacterota bacterium]
MECEISRKEAGLLVLLLVVLTACGGGDDDRGMGTDVGPGEVLPGNVSVDNRTPWDVEVAWLWVGEDGEAQVRRVSVPEGQVMGLTDAPLAAAQLTLDLVLLVPPETGPRVRRKAEVRVDGDRIVVVQASADDPFGVDVSISG